MLPSHEAKLPSREAEHLSGEAEHPPREVNAPFGEANRSAYECLEAQLLGRRVPKCNLGTREGISAASTDLSNGAAVVVCHPDAVPVEGHAPCTRHLVARPGRAGPCS